MATSHAIEVRITFLVMFLSDLLTRKPIVVVLEDLKISMQGPVSLLWKPNRARYYQIRRDKAKSARGDC